MVFAGRTIISLIPFLLMDSSLLHCLCSIVKLISLYVNATVDYDPTLQTFQPDPSLPVDGVKLDWGTYYAAKTFLGPNGRRLLFGWSTEDR